MRLRLWSAAAVALSAAAMLPALSASAGVRYDAQRVCRFQDARIGESSGLASSSFSDAQVWTHNDSGDTGRFFLVSTSSCKTLASYSIAIPPSLTIPGLGESLNNIDIEDMARARTTDGKPTLLLADIGDNQQVRNTHLIYEVAEPDGKHGDPAIEQSIQPMAVHAFTWLATAWDAESIAVLPDRRLVIVTKPRSAFPDLSYTGKSEIYVSARPMAAAGLDPLVMTKVADLDLIALTHVTSGEAIAATAADISQDGRRFAVRTYTTAFEWSVGKDGDLGAAVSKAPSTIRLMPTRQGEGIAYARDSRRFWTSSEGSGTDSNKASGVLDRYTRH